MGTHAASPAISADAEASYPAYPSGHAEDLYVDGYDPVSFTASHSSLLTNSLWIGFGFILASMAGFCLLITGASATLVAPEIGTAYDRHALLVIGAVIAAVCLVVGFALVAYSRRGYKAYVKRTGRYN